MNRFARTALVASALFMPLAACSSFDPTDIFDNGFFNSKKPLPGERKALFPNGTPGVPQGVPAELYKGYQEPVAQNGQGSGQGNGQASGQAGGQGKGQNAVATSQPNTKSPDAPEEEPRPKAKPKPKVAAAPPTATTARPAAATTSASSPWPDPPQQKGQPATTSSGGGQNIWPDPPAPGAVGR